MPPSLSDSQIDLMEQYGLRLPAEELGEMTLAHYGIPGMKWGVRRDRRTLDRLAGRNKSSGGKKTSKPSNSSKDKTEKAKRRADVRNKRNLSDRDIREKIDRLKLEREFSKLTSENLSPLRSRVNSMLVDAGFEVTKKLTVAAMNLVVSKALLGEKLTAADLGRLMAAQQGGKKK